MSHIQNDAALGRLLSPPALNESAAVSASAAATTTLDIPIVDGVLDDDYEVDFYLRGGVSVVFSATSATVVAAGNIECAVTYGAAGVYYAVVKRAGHASPKAVWGTAITLA